MEFKIYEVSTKQTKAGKLNLKDRILARSKKEVKKYIKEYSDITDSCDVIIEKKEYVAFGDIDNLARTNTVYSLFVTVIDFNNHDQLICAIAISMDDAIRRMRDIFSSILDDPEFVADYIEEENIIAIPLSEKDLYTIEESDIELDLDDVIGTGYCGMITGNENTNAHNIIAFHGASDPILIKDIHSEFEAVFLTVKYFLNESKYPGARYYINILCDTSSCVSVTENSVVVYDLPMYILSGGNIGIEK